MVSCTHRVSLLSDSGCLHLIRIKIMSHVSHQVFTELISTWNMLQSMWVVIALHNFASSAKRCKKESVDIIRNSIGSIIEPCGTPDVTGFPEGLHPR